MDMSDLLYSTYAGSQHNAGSEVIKQSGIPKDLTEAFEVLVHGVAIDAEVVRDFCDLHALKTALQDLLLPRRQVSQRLF
jgi:hypothetical protein